MKKLFMLCLAVAVCAPVSWAQQDLNKTLSKKVAAARSAAAYQKAQIRLTVTHYQLENYVNPAVSNQIHSGTLQVQTTCSALLLNAKGAVAIKKDCLPSINNAAKHNQIILFVDLKTLGNYEEWEDTVKPEDIGFPLYYSTENASRKDFVNQNDFILFSLPVRSNAVKSALNNLFPKGKEITAEKAAALLRNMPAAKTVKALHMY